MVTGRLIKIQRFSLSDGPGIRTTVFLKGCFLTCLWCSNPESQSFKPELFFHAGKCLAGCKACLSACPEKALTKRDEKLLIDRGLCNDCLSCPEACPSQALIRMGQDLSDEEVLKKVIRDESFYRHSGGGVTLSGGEPLYQFDFSLQLLKRCKKRSLHTTLDTTGHVPWKSLEDVLPYTDLLLYDLKHMDPDRHREWTGVGNELILQNALGLSQRGVPMVIRIPLLPGLNDTEENLKSLSLFVKGLKSVLRIEMMPYHRLGFSKYEALGKPYRLSGLLPPGKDLVLRAKGFLEASGKPICMA